MTHNYLNRIIQANNYRPSLFKELIGWWKLDARNKAFDLSGYGNHGLTNVGSMTLGTDTDRYGFSNGSTSFNGSQYIVLSKPSIFPLAPGSPCTISAWALMTNIAGFSDIMGWGTTGTSRITLYYNGGWRMYDGGADSGGSGTVTNNTWHHVVGTYDGSNVRSYVDNVLKGGPVAGNPTTATGINANIGTNSDAGVLMTGNMADVKVWKRCLNDYEMTQLYLMR